MAENSQSRMARRKQKQHKEKKKKSTWKQLIRIVIIGILLIGIGVAGLFGYYVATAPDLDVSELSAPASTKLYDINGDIFADLGTEKRSTVQYSDIPKILEDAILATEDVRFKSHIGIDFKRIGAAVLANFRDGFGAQGASTITQQVVKGSFLSNDKELKRKVQEQWLALQLERKYSKEEIFEMYVNKIYYGAGAYGVATAAEVYFGKTDLNDLTLAEAAILAGLPQRPSAYDPFVNPDLTKERMNTVLNLMVQHNKISEAEANEVRDTDVAALLVDSKKQYVKYESFIQQVRKEVEEKTGADIYKDSLQVYTTLDPEAQEYTEFLLSNEENNPIDYSADPDIQVGITLLDTKSGAIRAIGGGRNRDSDGWNFAIDGDGLQGGSTMKPIVAYGPAIEYLQWSTYHQLNDDKPFPIEGTDSVIRNWNRSYQGWMSARYALQESLNVPAVKTLDEVGYSNAQTFAEGLGIEFANNQVTITDAIGGTDTGVLPIEIAGAYAAFGNNGTYHEPYSVLKVEYPDRRTEELASEPEEAMSDFTAYMVTDMLKSVVQNGTGTNANISGLPIAGKTGTTNLKDQDGSPDSWFTGYTTNYTISIWSGYSKERKPINNTQLPVHIFRELMQHVSSDVETADFQKPDSVVEVAVEKGSNPAKRPSEYTPSSEIVTELFVKGHEPSAVSEKFDQLDPVTNLAAVYDEEEERINVEWEYEDMENTTFEVSVAADGSAGNVTETESTSLEISNIEQGGTYTIEVVARKGDTTSEPATVTVEVSGGENEDIPPVQQLQQTFDQDNLSSLITWAYEPNGPIEFRISLTEAGNIVDEFTTNQTSLNLTQLQAGRIYTVTVTPVLRNEGGVTGPSSSIQINTQGLEEDEQNNEPPDEQQEEQQEEQQNGNTNEGNSNENQNGSQNNGNQGQNQQEQQNDANAASQNGNSEQSQENIESENEQ
ncbi:penicillin-binding protein 1A [Gracilibacillus ureilyticus]|uniref:Penicillin-binding protein 1A n=1 Tax=Gracilibacillus ureilyticus TaxID=531814 RepID=A0A1H9LLJ8_9BACI|nr:PBP1A family penicillin-binding protein [Gracilibacillus ureilyticus]SER12351.1 penicillin-binding protein 1A [Gracilibacillus ureilyticus]